MKQIKTKLRALALAAGSLAITMAGANAANSFYAPGDLVLFFQQDGGTQTVYANLGNAATLYRGAATGAAGGTNSLNFLDLSSTLSTAFGAGWASDTSLYAGLAGVWGTSNTLGNLQDGDPQRTLYVSAARSGVGTIGQANSSPADMVLAGNSALTTAATGIQTQNNILENSYATAVAQSPVGTSQIDNQNTFSLGIQNAAFNSSVAGGVQQKGSAGVFSASFGDAGSTEFALDLYRFQGRDNIATQVGFGEGLRLGTYEGTVSVGTDGQVSFTAVPEPSTYALLGLSALVIGYVVRRRRAQNL
jgi:hypothetical protein